MIPYLFYLQYELFFDILKVVLKKAKYMKYFYFVMIFTICSNSTMEPEYAYSSPEISIKEEEDYSKWLQEFLAEDKMEELNEFLSNFPMEEGTLTGTKRKSPQENPSEKEFSKKSKKEISISTLPKELREYILSFLVTSEGYTQNARLYKAVENIRNFMMLNKSFKALLEDNRIITVIITELAKRYTGNNKTKAAVILGTKAAGEWLLKNPDEIDMYSSTKLFIDAIKEENKEIINFLLQFVPATVTSSIASRLGEDTPLNAAIEKNNIPLIDKLLLAGAPVNPVDLLERTPLIVAISLGSYSLVEKLLRAGADPNSQDLLGTTPLLFIQAHEIPNKEAIIELLRSYGAI